MLNFKTKKWIWNLYKKENLKPEVKVIIENILDELYRLQNKLAKDAKLRANIRWGMENKKCTTFLQSTSETESAKSWLKLDWLKWLKLRSPTSNLIIE